MKKIILGTLLAAAALTANAGDKGNGGYIVNCGGSYELADFHEVRVLSGLNNKFNIIRNSEISAEDQIEEKIDKLQNILVDVDIFYNLASIGGDIRRENNKLQGDSVNWLTGEFTWKGTDDLGLFPSIDGCNEPENVFYYLSDKYIDARKDLYDKLSPTDQAGLIVHEIVYKLTRKYSKQTTSWAARRITALLFSDLEDDLLLKNMILRYIVPSHSIGHFNYIDVPSKALKNNSKIEFLFGMTNCRTERKTIDGQNLNYSLETRYKKSERFSMGFNQTAKKEHVQSTSFTKEPFLMKIECGVMAPKYSYATASFTPGLKMISDDGKEQIYKSQQPSKWTVQMKAGLAISNMFLAVYSQDLIDKIMYARL